MSRPEPADDAGTDRPAPRKPAVRRLPRAGPWIVAAAVLVLHLAILEATPAPDPFVKYPAAARADLAGELPAERLADFSPLYLEATKLLVRVAPDRAVGGLVALQVLLVAAAAGLLVGWLRRRVPPALALGAAAALALDARVLVHERIPEPEILLLTLVVGWLAALDRRPGAAGVAAALAIATRPTLLPLALATPVADRLRRGRWEGRRALAFLLPVALGMGLLALRNHHATGSFRMPAMNPGTVFFEGNNPLSRGTSAVYPPAVLELTDTAGQVPDSPHVLYRRIARLELGDAAGPAEVNAWWAGKAGRFLREEPQAAFDLLEAKLARAFHGFSWHDVPPAWQLELRLPIPTTPAGLLGALALVGALLEARRWRRHALVLGLFGLQLAVLLVFYVSARQQLVWLPALLYFAARGLAAWPGLPRPGRFATVALAAALSLGFSLPTTESRAESRFRQGWLEAEALLGELRRRSSTAPPLARHLDLVAEAVAAAPWWVDRLSPSNVPRTRRDLEDAVVQRLARRDPRSPAERFDLGHALLLAGRDDRAREVLAALADEEHRIDRGPWHPSSPRLLLARLALRRGDREEAIRWLEAAERARPGDPWVLAERVALDGDPEARRRLEAWWDPLDRELMLGRALLEQGRAARAVEHLERALGWFPELRRARIDLAAALGESGRTEAGVEHYLVAIRLGLDPVRRAPEIRRLFAAWADARADDPAAALLAARVIAHLGDFDEADRRLQALEERSAAELPTAGLGEVRELVDSLRAAVPPPSPDEDPLR